MRFYSFIFPIIIAHYAYGILVNTTVVNLSNDTSIVIGYEPLSDDVTDIPRRLQKGRKHCFKSPTLYCANNRRCCTHVHRKKIWCCDRKHKCGKSPMTCLVNHL